MRDNNSLLKKLKTLAERGDPGERELAEAAFQKLSKKYGIAIEDLNTESIKAFEFEFHGDEEKRLLHQIAWKVTNDLDNCYDLKWSKSGRKCKTRINIHCTEAQKLEIEFLFDFYKRVWEQEKRMLYKAFICKHDIFGESGCIENKTHFDYEISKLAALMAGLSDETPHKQITSSPVGTK